MPYTIHNVEQKSVEWLALKRGKISGSRLHDLLVKRGNGVKMEYYRLLAERLGLPDEDDLASDMERGERLEFEARELAGKEIGLDFKMVGFITRDDNANIGVSPDGLTEDHKHALEIKCFSSARHLQVWKEGVPDEVREQVIQYFIVMDDLETVDIVFHDPRVIAKPLIIHRISRAEVEEEIKSIREQEDMWLARLEADTEELLGI